jgi:hypothetical protein
MNNKDFTTTILVDQTPTEVFNAVNNPRSWWSEEIDGDTNNLNAEWNYHYKDVHRNQMSEQVNAAIPGGCTFLFQLFVGMRV